ncbi:MAG: hypothetical protein EA406_12780 [Rhodospirillales bacterium]|nr:MAG: hypothetical protein EA406_12780 [Rhodospirillales bacterium]
MNFFKVLLNPEEEEREQGDRTLVASAANIIQVGEFQFLQLAYREWYDKDLPEGIVAKLFTSYMLHDEVPHWARHYARLILMRDESGTLDENDPAFHRYDHEYRTVVPEGVKKFTMAVLFLAFTLACGIVAANLASQRPLSVLPPYFLESEIDGQRTPTGDDGAGPEAPDRRR